MREDHTNYEETPRMEKAIKARVRIRTFKATWTYAFGSWTVDGTLTPLRSTYRTLTCEHGGSFGHKLAVDGAVERRTAH